MNSTTLALTLCLLGQMTQPREWTDIDGRHKITARFDKSCFDVSDPNDPEVKLRAMDDRVISVPLRKLAREDRRFAEEYLRSWLLSKRLTEAAKSIREHQYEGTTLQRQLKALEYEAQVMNGIVVEFDGKSARYARVVEDVTDEGVVYAHGISGFSPPGGVYMRTQFKWDDGDAFDLNAGDEIELTGRIDFRFGIVWNDSVSRDAIKKSGMPIVGLDRENANAIRQQLGVRVVALTYDDWLFFWKRQSASQVHKTNPVHAERRWVVQLKGMKKRHFPATRD